MKGRETESSASNTDFQLDEGIQNLCYYYITKYFLDFILLFYFLDSDEETFLSGFTDEEVSSLIDWIHHEGEMHYNRHGR